jgi:hypothetical protein
VPAGFSGVSDSIAPAVVGSGVDHIDSPSDVDLPKAPLAELDGEKDKTPKTQSRLVCMKERLCYLTSSCWNGLKNIPSVVLGVFKSIFTSITGLFSRKKTEPEEPVEAKESAKDVKAKEDIKKAELAIEGRILATLTEVEGRAFAEADSELQDVVLKKAIGRYEAIMHAKTCLGEVLTDENREGIALEEAANAISTRL